MLLLLSAAFAAGCADDKEEGGNDIKLNPDPTQLSNIAGVETHADTRRSGRFEA